MSKRSGCLRPTHDLRNSCWQPCIGGEGQRTRVLSLFLDEWQRILEQEDWTSALSDSQRVAQLRQASPMATLLDHGTRLRIIREVGVLAERSSVTATEKGGLPSAP